jgi:hypothetical protein
MAGQSVWNPSLTTEALTLAQFGGDAHANEEPVHDDTYDFDANDFNNIAKGLAQVVKRLRYGNLVPYSFSTADASGTATTQLQALGNDTAIKYATALMGGSIVGLTIWVEGARTAGSLTATATVNGASSATLSCVIDGSNTQYNRAYQLPGTVTFSAKDRLGVQIVTASSFAAGTTPSCRVDLFVSYGEEESI